MPRRILDESPRPARPRPLDRRSPPPAHHRQHLESSRDEAPTPPQSAAANTEEAGRQRPVGSNDRCGRRCCCTGCDLGSRRDADGQRSQPASPNYAAAGHAERSDKTPGIERPGEDHHIEHQDGRRESVEQAQAADETEDDQAARPQSPPRRLQSQCPSRPRQQCPHPAPATPHAPDPGESARVSPPSLAPNAPIPTVDTPHTLIPLPPTPQPPNSELP